MPTQLKVVDQKGQLDFLVSLLSNAKRQIICESRCREDFRPQAETRATRANERCATLHTYIMYL